MIERFPTTHDVAKVTAESRAPVMPMFTKKSFFDFLTESFVQFVTRDEVVEHTVYKIEMSRIIL